MYDIRTREIQEAIQAADVALDPLKGQKEVSREQVTGDCSIL